MCESRLSSMALLGALAAMATGCMGPLFRPQSPQSQEELHDATSAEVQLIGEITHPYGLGFLKIENVALVTGLDGAGEDPAPSPQRAALLAEMNRREIEDPNAVLASPDTALVAVRAVLRPGIQQGESFDVELRTLTRSDVKSLRGGTLLETRLTETAILGDQIRKGHIMAYAAGPIMVDPSADEDELIGKGLRVSVWPMEHYPSHTAGSPATTSFEDVCSPRKGLAQLFGRVRVQK